MFRVFVFWQSQFRKHLFPVSRVTTLTCTGVGHVRQAALFCHRIAPVPDGIAPTGTPTVIAFAMCLITSSGFFQVEFKSPMTQIRITLRETSIASLEVVVP